MLRLDASRLSLLVLLVATNLRTAALAAEDAHPTEMWVVDLARLDRAEETLALTLQGLVAKKRPAIWIRTSGMSEVILGELAKEGTRLRNVDSIWSLVDTFRSAIRGFVTYELGTDSINVATSLSGPKRAIAVDASLVERARKEGLTQILDVRGLDEFKAYSQFGTLFRRDELVVQDESKHAHLRDWATLRDAFCFYGLTRSHRAEILRKTGPGATVFGWEGEHEFVRAVSRAQGTVIPADWSRNLSTLSRLRVPIPARPRRVPDPARKGERIVAFVMSDGDNIQWMAGGFVHHRGFWASPHRGSFPMTWEMAPILAEVAPRALRHFYRTASNGENLDDFVTGPSGAGYSFPHHLPDRRAFARLTADRMKKAGLSIVTLLNSGGSMNESIEMLERPETLGAIYKGWIYNSEKGRVLWHQGKPCVSYRYLLWEPRADKSPEGVARAIAGLPADPTRDIDSYALVNVHAWSFRSIGGPMEAVRRCIEKLPPRTRVVTAEQLVLLLRQHFGNPVSREAIEMKRGR